MKQRMWAALVRVLFAASAASGQVISNGNFETGSLLPWTVVPTAGGTSLATGVVTYDVDGPKPFPASNAARFMVGATSPPLPPASWEGIELTQPVELEFLGERSYTFWVHWSVNPVANVYNQSGGRFDLIVNGEVIDTDTAPSTTGLQASYGFLIGDFSPDQGGIHDVGVRITRPVLAGEEVFQYLDNFGVKRCYADCNQNGAVSIADFTCFQNQFLMGEPVHGLQSERHAHGCRFHVLLERVRGGVPVGHP